jgi:hypothetical protein
MRILVACEYSGVIRDAFARKGHDAWSCDLEETISVNKSRHIKGDVLDLLARDSAWDMVIAHPPCTYLCNSGAQWYYHPEDKHLPVNSRRPHPDYPNRQRDREEAKDFFLIFASLSFTIPKVCIENPIGIMSKWKKPTQIIQPWQFGHTAAKATCLWLWGLPKLEPTKIVEPDYVTTPSGKRHCPWYSNNKGLRSVTFYGIGEAMANQWG